MNDDAFEDRLRALASQLQRPDPTPEWKAEILSRAAQARTHAAPRTPRWLLATLGAAWVLIVLLRFTTPHDSTTMHQTVASAPSVDPSTDTPWRTLMAFHSNPELLDLP